jgi:hypothetical protein
MPGLSACAFSHRESTEPISGSLPWHRSHIMFHRITLLPLILGSLLLCSDRGLSGDDKEKEIAPKNGMYTIKLPAGDQSEDRPKYFMIGKHLAPIETARSVKDKTTYAGSSIGIPAVAMREIQADKRFDIIRDAFAEGIKGKVTEEKDVEKDGIPGREFMLTLPKSTARCQIFTIAGWVVAVVVEGRKENVNSKDADAFFESLKMTDMAKEVFEEVKR